MTFARTASAFLFAAALLTSASATLAQHSAHYPPAPAKAHPAATKRATDPNPVVVESLSGLDLVPYGRTGTFGIRINHRITKAATLRLIDTKTSHYVINEMLEPGDAPTRAVQAGRLANGEYKMEMVMSDTTYWKTVRVSRR